MSEKLKGKKRINTCESCIKYHKKLIIWYTITFVITLWIIILLDYSSLYTNKYLNTFGIISTLFGIEYKKQYFIFQNSLNKTSTLVCSVTTLISINTIITIYIVNILKCAINKCRNSNNNNSNIKNTDKNSVPNTSKTGSEIENLSNINSINSINNNNIDVKPDLCHDTSFDSDTDTSIYSDELSQTETYIYPTKSIKKGKAIFEETKNQKIINIDNNLPKLYIKNNKTNIIEIQPNGKDSDNESLSSLSKVPNNMHSQNIFQMNMLNRYKSYA